MEFAYFHTVTANMQRRKKAQERVQQLQSKAAEAWDNCIPADASSGRSGRDRAAQKTSSRQGTGDTAISMLSSFTTYILRHYPETRATLVELSDFKIFAVCTFRALTERNELIALRRILLTIEQELTLWRRGSATLEAFGFWGRFECANAWWTGWYHRAESLPRTESAQHRKHMELILQFMSHQHPPAWRGGSHAALDVDTQLKAPWRGREQCDANWSTAAWVHPRRLVLSDHQQVIAKLKRPEGPGKATE